jgi:hypothetical protein
MNRWTLYCLLLALWAPAGTGASVAIWAYANQGASALTAIGIWGAVSAASLGAMRGVYTFVEMDISGSSGGGPTAAT